MRPSDELVRQLHFAGDGWEELAARVAEATDAAGIFRRAFTPRESRNDLGEGATMRAAFVPPETSADPGRFAAEAGRLIAEAEDAAMVDQLRRVLPLHRLSGDGPLTLEALTDAADAARGAPTVLLGPRGADALVAQGLEFEDGVAWIGRTLAFVCPSMDTLAGALGEEVDVLLLPDETAVLVPDPRSLWLSAGKDGVRVATVSALKPGKGSRLQLRLGLGASELTWQETSDLTGVTVKVRHLNGAHAEGRGKNRADARNKALAALDAQMREDAAAAAT